MSVFAVIFQLAENAVDVHVFKRFIKEIVSGDVFGLIGDVVLTDEDGDIGMGDSTGVSASLDGEIFLGGKKCWESNIGDSDKTRDGGKIVSGAIGACGGIASMMRWRARKVDLKDVWCWRVFVYKEVTKRHLEALELKGSDGGACEVLGWLLG
nr:hypothetical protein [Tanacetum cinerariifolium]